jgi:hypothetical protein
MRWSGWCFDDLWSKVQEWLEHASIVTTRLYDRRKMLCRWCISRGPLPGIATGRPLPSLTFRTVYERLQQTWPGTKENAAYLRIRHLAASTLEIARLPEPVRRQLPTLYEGHFITQGHNILAFGLPGRGKTHLLYATGQALIEAATGCALGKRIASPRWHGPRSSLMTSAISSKP